MAEPANRILDLRKARGLSLQDVADAAGTSQQQVSRLEKGRRGLTDKWMRRLAKALDCDPAHLLAPSENPETDTPSPSELADMGAPFRPVRPRAYEPAPRDVPIRGAAAGNHEGEFQLGEAAIDHAPRPQGTPNARDVYAIYLVGESMWPRYKPGAVIYVSPHRPPQIGDDVVVQIHEESGEVRAMVKNLVRQTAKTLFLEQYNPKKTIEIAKAANVVVHRIFETNELQGV